MRRIMIAVIVAVAWTLGVVVVGCTTAAPVAAGVDLAALGHDGQSDIYRVPTGVVTPGGAVTIRFRTAADGVDAVTLRLTDRANQLGAGGGRPGTAARVDPAARGRLPGPRAPQGGLHRACSRTGLLRW